LKRLMLVAACAIAAAGTGVAAYVVHVRHEGRTIVGSRTLEFHSRQVPRRPAVQRGRIVWATYGLGPARTRSLDGAGLTPPYRRLWTWHGGALLEFPPVVAGGRLFMPTFDGRFYGLDARTGRAIWRYDSGRCGWASPALAGPLVVETFIGRACAEDVPGRDGEVVAFERATGRVRWRRVIGPTESSPLVANGLVYVGDWSGRVYALSARTGATRWVYRTGGKVKGSAALAGGRIYVGSYDGRVYCLSARTGRLIWRASAQPLLGGRGSFYSTPALDYDRVYIGSTDGKVYSFGAESGKLRWSRPTGGYVYAAPAVWHELVLVGSYSRRFFALDAATGRARWSFAANGPISGAASVVDGVVYFSTFAHRTYALDARSGRLMWTWPDGEYSPVVTDGRRLYLTGRGRLYALVRVVPGRH
jgi:outer membrane protein assembly factor BamB